MVEEMAQLLSLLEKPVDLSDLGLPAKKKMFPSTIIKQKSFNFVPAISLGELITD